MLPTGRHPTRLPASTGRALLHARKYGVAMCACMLLTAFSAPCGMAQSVPLPGGDSSATLRVEVHHGIAAISGALIRSIDSVYAAGPLIGASTDRNGYTVLRLPAGEHRLLVSRLGFRPDTLVLALRASQDTSITVHLAPVAEDIETMVVSATRAERRVEDTPLRVEVVDEEEVAEKLAMRPASIQMLLAETGGLRVQTTSPSLGNANVRVQGLRGRYSLLLTDGLPLAGDGGGFSLLQTPIDLGRVEVLKGASGLYSGGAGGVINLVSRRPGSESDHTVLLNQTSRGGSDALGFFTGPLSEHWGYTLLSGLHHQERHDVDGDGWTDMTGYERAALRPRLYYDNGSGRTAFVTAGFTAEDRTGGTTRDAVLPGGAGFAENLQLRRGDLGLLARMAFTDSTTPAGMGFLRGGIATLRGSAVQQRHAHGFGEVNENDRHRTGFGEASLALPRGDAVYVLGAAYQRDSYNNASVKGWDYGFNTLSAFAQADLDPVAWLSLSSSVRADMHNVYGSFLNPRVSLLLRPIAGGSFSRWTARVSGGTGMYAPTPVTEEVEAVGLTPLERADGGMRAFSAERIRSISMDVGGPMEVSWGDLELNLSLFESLVRNPLEVRAADGFTADGASRIALVNAPGQTRTWGSEVLARLVRELGDERGDDSEAHTLRVTASYSYLRSTECDPDGIVDTYCARRDVPLTPRNAATLVASVEQEGKSRLGLEVYYTGRQQLEPDLNPYRSSSRPYVLVGFLAERAFETRAGLTRVFVNFENITNVRQTRFDSLLLPTRGRGGRWTTDAWTELVGFTVNAGLRFGF